MPAVTAAQMAEIDRAATEQYGIAVEMLMENASHQVAVACRAFLGDVAGKRIECMRGTGNNGGDALGAARRLHGWGARVRCILAAPAERLHATARKQHDVARAVGVPVVGADEAILEEADLVVDALLGYSAHGAPRGDLERLIWAANKWGGQTVAVDLPSGLDPDTGNAPGAVIRAACTVTLGLPKTGLLAPRARDVVGEVLLADIGIPPEAYERLGLDVRPVFARGDLVRVVR